MAVCKILYVSTPEMLESNLKDQPVSNFVAGLLGGRDAAASAYAIQMAEVLMEKLPAIYRPYFLKEGVLHAMDQIAASAPAPTAGTSSHPEPKSTSPSEGAKGVGARCSGLRGVFKFLYNN